MIALATATVRHVRGTCWAQWRTRLDGMVIVACANIFAANLHKRMAS
jgi:hypothetical protein